MTTLEHVIVEVPQLRDNLDVQSLNAMAMTCRGLATATASSDSYRKHFNSKQAGFPLYKPALRDPELAYKTLCHGKMALVKRFTDEANVTQADLDALHEYSKHLNPAYYESREPEDLAHVVVLRGPAKPPPREWSLSPESKKLLAKTCGFAATVIAGSAGVAALFLYGAPVAGAVALCLVCVLLLLQLHHISLH